MQLSDTAECSVHCRNYCKLCALENSMKTPWLTPLYLVYISFWNHFHHIFILLNASVVFITLRKSLTASWLVIYTLTHCPWYLLLWKFWFVRLREYWVKIMSFIELIQNKREFTLYIIGSTCFRQTRKKILIKLFWDFTLKFHMRWIIFSRWRTHGHWSSLKYLWWWRRRIGVCRCHGLNLELYDTMLRWSKTERKERKLNWNFCIHFWIFSYDLDQREIQYLQGV
jgi:hypothetical protein